MIHRLRTAAIRPQSNQLVRPERANRDGDLDSGLERWEVRPQATWQAIEDNLNGREITNRRVPCGVTITMEREAQPGEVEEEQDRRVRRVRHFRPQDMRVRGSGLQAEGSRGIIHSLSKYKPTKTKDYALNDVGDSSQLTVILLSLE